ncbi:hypothetical protein MHYP_G00248250 [Metynnis hypsauchen]
MNLRFRDLNCVRESETPLQNVLRHALKLRPVDAEEAKNESMATTGGEDDQLLPLRAGMPAGSVPSMDNGLDNGVHSATTIVKRLTDLRLT